MRHGSIVVRREDAPCARLSGCILCAASAAAVCALAAGCAAHRSTPRSSAPEATPTSLAAECGDTHGARVRPLWLHASDGRRLYAIGGGSGPAGVLLVPESPPGSVCGWLSYIATLEHAGPRVLSVDYRGTGGSIVRSGRDPYA